MLNRIKQIFGIKTMIPYDPSLFQKTPSDFEHTLTVKCLDNSVVSIEIDKKGKVCQIYSRNIRRIKNKKKFLSTVMDALRNHL